MTPEVLSLITLAIGAILGFFLGRWFRNRS
jgi:hypothetical protein